jgi:hypothetical protein
MALDPSMEDPCSILNIEGYPTLWVQTSPSLENDLSAYAKIATGGITKKYLQTLTSTTTGPGMAVINLDTPVVNSAQTTSRFRLLQFMSGGGISGVNYTKLSGLALKSGTAYESIVDTYIVSPTGLGKTNYTYSTSENPIVTESNIWTPGDDKETTPVSILGKLIKKGYLLSEGELSTDAGNLISLYRQEQSGTPLDATQAIRKTTLESRNLRFFGAFLCEYCFYRTRYEWLLSKYFTIYNTPIAQYSFPANALVLFAGSGSGDNQYTGLNPSQPDLLKVIAYHMACLNTRMTDMRSLLGKINTYYNGVFTNIQTTLNEESSIVGSNSELTKTIKALQMSNREASSYLSQTDFMKSVMEYNSEKNRYSNILLGLYAFLNIAALATVFQLARTS